MTLVVYHRTTIADARRAVEKGFQDADWDFGLRDAQTGEDVLVTGVWLSDRPLSENDGVAGDAQLEVSLDVGVADLASYELEGMMWNARVWVVSADLINEQGKVRILGVDPGTSWFHKAWSEDD